MSDKPKVLKESYFGIMVSPDGRFFRNGKEKKVVYATNILGKKATAKLTIMIDGKVHYWQAAKLVAKAYLADYEDGCNIIYLRAKSRRVLAEMPRVGKGRTQGVCFRIYRPK